MKEQKSFEGITLLGLGIVGEAETLTLKAWGWLQNVNTLCVWSHSFVDHLKLPEDTDIIILEELLDKDRTGEEICGLIVEKVLEMAGRSGGVTYAVSGTPFMADYVNVEITRQAREQGIAVQIIDGMSFVEPTLSVLQLDLPSHQVTVYNALNLLKGHVPVFSYAVPVLLTGVYSQQVAVEVKQLLLTIYPESYAVKLIHAAGTRNQVIEDFTLGDIDGSGYLGEMTTLYLPAMPVGSSFEEFLELVAHLRAPDGCPWDRKQTHQSLRTHLLEETYEALTALDANDIDSMREEFGDLLLQIVLHAQIASENGNFNIVDIIRGVHHKITWRHPHVFGDVQVDDVDGVLRNWEDLKAAERKANGQEHKKGLLDGVPKVYPALSQAQEYQERVGRVGFDWDRIEPVWDKVLEEIEELKEAVGDKSRSFDELGDLLFAVVNLARWLGVDSESALRNTNLRFRTRFAYIENQSRITGKKLTDMTLAEMDEYWEKAKLEEKGIEIKS